VQLADVVFGKRNILPGVEFQFHHLGIPSHFLLVAAGAGGGSKGVGVLLPICIFSRGVALSGIRLSGIRVIQGLN
jgi:hypothetical protein